MPHLDIWDDLSRQPFYLLLYLTGVIYFAGCRSVCRGMSFIGLPLHFHTYRNLDYTPQFIHAVEVPARLRMYGDGVAPQSGFWDFHNKVVSRYLWHMNCRKTHTAPPSCPSAPFFEAGDITRKRDIVDSCDTSSLTACVGRNSELHRVKHFAKFSRKQSSIFCSKLLSRFIPRLN